MAKAKVKATAKGFHISIREPGDVFEVDFGKDTAKMVKESTWLEAVSNSKSAPAKTPAPTGEGE